MGICRYCGGKAGFLRSQHKECETKHKSVVAEIANACWAAATGSYDPNDAKRWVELKSPEGWISDPKPFFVKAWGDSVRKDLEDGVLSLEEQERLDHVKEAFGLTAKDLGAAWLMRCQGMVIREVLEGRIPEHGIDFQVPLVIQKTEKIIWGWSNVKQFQERNRTTYRGASQGMSFKVAKGVYYRVGATRGEPVVTTSQALVGVGALVFTDKNLYWGGGSGKAIKIPWKKIIAVQSFSDGVGITKDGVSAKPMIFAIGKGEGWLARNLAENLPHLE
jgi:hypothetical protein